MDHYLVMPMSDPKGPIVPRVERVRPALEEFFSGAVISVPPGEISPALSSSFYLPVTAPVDQPIGAQFHALYQYAAGTCPPESVLHLCFPDRLVYQMESAHKHDFLSSLHSIDREMLPILFQRSAAAWESHPANYRQIEASISSAGRWIFGKWLDFAWCHLALEAGCLKRILPAVRRTDMSMMAEIVVEMVEEIHPLNVDWLA